MPTATRTVGNVINEALTWIGRDTVEMAVGRPDMKVILNEAAQDVYDFVSINDVSLIVKKASFGSGTTISLPSDFKTVVLVEIPTAASGAARKAEPRDYDYAQGIQNIKGSANDPIYDLNATTFTLSPAAAGTLYYIPKFDDSVLNVESTDLKTIFPRTYIQDLIIKMMYLAVLRHSRSVKINPTNLQSRALRMQKTRDILKAAEKSYNISATDTGAPATLQSKAAEGGLYGD